MISPVGPVKFVAAVTYLNYNRTIITVLVTFLRIDDPSDTYSKWFTRNSDFCTFNYIT